MTDFSLHRKLSWIVAAASALLLSVSLFLFEKKNHRSHEGVRAEALARQGLALFESMYSDAKSRTERDPFATALRLAKQNDPSYPKAIEFRNWNRDLGGEQDLTQSRLSVTETKVVLQKWLDPLDPTGGNGVLIEVPFKPVGFLGARGTLAGDIRVGLFALVLFALFWFVFEWFTSRSRFDELTQSREHFAERLGRVSAELESILKGMSLPLEGLEQGALLLEGEYDEYRKFSTKTKDYLHASLSDVHALKTEFLKTERESAATQLALLQWMQKHPEFKTEVLMIEAQVANLRRQIQDLKLSTRKTELEMEARVNDVDIHYQDLDAAALKQYATLISSARTALDARPQRETPPSLPIAL